MSIGYVSEYGPVRRGPLLGWRKTLVILGAVGASLYGVLAAPGLVNADSVGGYGTNGACIGPGMPYRLWSQSVVGVSRLKIKFTLSMRTSGNAPTVVQGGWQLSTGSTWETTYWQNNQLGGGTTTMTIHVGVSQAGVSDVGTGVAVANGSTGIAAYSVLVRGYDSGSCMIVSNVVVERAYWGVSATTPPGGGGFGNPTPTPAVPAPTPTTPVTPTAIPGATPGPGVVCFTFGTVQACYPAPPTGWCYIDSPGGGTSVELVECAGPTATPQPNEKTGSCHVSVGADMSPNTYTKRHECHVSVPGTTGGTGVVTPNYFIPAGSAGRVLRMTITALSPANSHDWLIFTNQAGQQSNVSASVTPQNPVGITYCFVMNTSNNVPIPTTSFPAGCIQHASSTVDNEAFAIGSRWCCGNLDTGSQTIRFEMFSSIASFNANGGFAGPTPTPTLALPPNYCGPGNATCPPQGAGGGGENNVDICADNPGILACAYSFPPEAGGLCDQYPGVAACATAPAPIGSPDASAAQGAFVDVYNHLMSKAPFGYFDQVGQAVDDTIANAAGADPEWCFENSLSVGGTHEWCIEDLSGMAAAGRALLLAICVAIFAFALFQTVSRAPDGG